MIATWLTAAPHRPPPLDSEGVHVWKVPIEAEARLEWSWLSASEQRRAAHMRFPTRWAAARIALRTLLGAYTGQDPERVVLTERPPAKPALAPRAIGVPTQDLRFSLAHSRDLAVVAVAQAREVGVDVEEVRPIDDLLAVAARALGPKQAKLLRLLPARERISAFFTAWTRREAIVKCWGTGLIEPGEPDPGPRPTVVDLEVGAGYACAVAVEGAGAAISLFDTAAVPLPHDRR
jgi:4'-phosphopantetheinyl transferase